MTSSGMSWSSSVGTCHRSQPLASTGSRRPGDAQCRRHIRISNRKSPINHQNVFHTHLKPQREPTHHGVPRLHHTVADLLSLEDLKVYVDEGGWLYLLAVDLGLGALATFPAVTVRPEQLCLRFPASVADIRQALASSRSTYPTQMTRIPNGQTTTIHLLVSISASRSSKGW